MAKKRKRKFVEDPAKPCLRCLVADPVNCNKRSCLRWQSWWMRRWDYTRELCRSRLPKEDA